MNTLFYMYISGRNSFILLDLRIANLASARFRHTTTLNAYIQDIMTSRARFPHNQIAYTKNLAETCDIER